MYKKLIPSVGVLVFLILVPLHAHAAFTCTLQGLAGAFSGVVAGTDTGTPFSEFLFVTLNSNGTFTTFEVVGEPGNVAQTISGTGTWSIFDATNCFAVAFVGGSKFVLNFADDGDMILFSSPFDPNLQAAGVLRRSGT